MGPKIPFGSLCQMDELVNLSAERCRTLTPVQLRAARAALNWTIQKLSEMSGLGVNTIKRAEAGSGHMTAVNAARLIDVFMQHGVRFVRHGEAQVGILFGEHAG
jgi:DNA-binding transcriptional regulator YiaG